MREDPITDAEMTDGDRFNELMLSLNPYEFKADHPECLKHMEAVKEMDARAEEVNEELKAKILEVRALEAERQSLITARETEKLNLFLSAKKHFPEEYKKLDDDCHFEMRGEHEEELWVVKTVMDKDGNQVYMAGPTTTINVQGKKIKVSDAPGISAAQKALEESIKHVKEELEKKKKREEDKDS